MSFMSKLQHTATGNDYNIGVSENGAIGYRTTGKALLDLNFSVASLRKATPGDIIARFLSAFGEDKDLALKWLFFCRDVRGGLGERRTFRIIFRHLVLNHSDVSRHLVEYIPEYGRWDDLVLLVDDTPIEPMIIELIKKQLKEDWDNARRRQSISLLAKWLPSNNTTSKETVHRARRIARKLGWTERKYRTTLSFLRNHLKIVETKMSRHKWHEIDYQEVPSRANLLYSDAFLKRDPDRRRRFLEAIERGEAKINAGTLFPHDIVHKYSRTRLPRDGAIEALWKNLPNVVDPNSRTIVVADGSGSMSCFVSGDVTALEVANSLAIYFAERLTGEFNNKYITFSDTPQLVDLSGCESLYEKLLVARRHCEVADTNVERVFNLILDTVVQNRMHQEEMPTNILIISDMEFNRCGGEHLHQRLFNTIANRYAEAGYKLPRLIFWNVNSRTGFIPIIENELGIALVSGFSVNIAKMVMSGILDPYECLKEVLLSERYAKITASARR